MSLSDEWAQELGNVELTYLYRILDRAIETDARDDRYLILKSKGEHDVAWAVKDEYERRAAAGEGVF
jgi:cation transport regulator ChaB